MALSIIRFVVLFVTTLHCKVSMAMSGDLDAPLTGLGRSGGLPVRVTPRLDVGPATRKLGQWVIGPDEPCPTASCVEGNGKHGSQTPTGRTTLQINLCVEPLSL